MRLHTCSIRDRSAVLTTGLALGIAVTVVAFGQESAHAAQPPVGLGTAASFAVLAHTTVTNTGPSVVTGDVGVDPGTAITGFTGPPQGTILGGVKHAKDPVAAQAQLNLTTAYNDAAGRKPVTAVAADLSGRTLAAGIYRGPTLGLTGTVTLDAKNDPAAVFVFQAGSTLITSSSSVVALVNGASPCNVYWQVGSSATLGTNSSFVGTVMAQASVSATTGATVQGRLLARTGAVTLDDNVITRPQCTSPGGGSTSSPAGGSSAPGGGSSTPGGGGSSAPGGGSSAPGGGGGSSAPGGGGSATGSAGGPGVPLRTTSARSATSSTPSLTATTSASTQTTFSSPSTSTPGQPPLAQTGTGDLGLLKIAGLAIVLGGLVLMLGRRRRHAAHRLH